MERNQKIPIVIVYNNQRKELVEQTLRTVKEKADLPYELFTIEDKKGELNYLKLKNKLIKDIPYAWDKIIVADDDLYFNTGWLSAMVRALKENPDVWVVAGTTWHTHEHLEKRKDITITGIVCGGCWIMKREVWDKCGLFDIDAKKTHMFVDRVHEQGGKVAFLNNKLKIVHCGVKSLIDKRGRSLEIANEIQKLAIGVRAKTNYEDSIRK